MHRRKLLAASVTGVALFAGCGGDGPTNEAGAQAETDIPYTTSTPSPTASPSATRAVGGSVTGEVLTEGFSAERLAGEIDAGSNTLTVTASVRNETGESTIVTAVLYNFFDADGEKVVSANEQIEPNKEVADGETFGFEQTFELSKNDAESIDSMEVFVQSR
jgi:hypothetical protein